MKKNSINYNNTELMTIDPYATGKQLRNMRIANDFTQEKLSEVLEKYCERSVSRNYISMLENGKKTPSLVLIVFLAGLYNCTLDELVITHRQSKEKDDRDQLPLFIYQSIMLRQFPYQ